MVHELLAPAGNMASLEQALYNGADAIYIGGSDFNARHFAENFTNEDIIKAIKLCHLYNVKLYVAMNTLIKDPEVPMFLGQIEFLYKNGIDAVIMQDFGMISLVREKYPNLPIHASTQANNSSIETIRLYANMGVKRVILAREMSLKQIKSIKEPIELEVFIHGALCVSYSGRCLMSSMLGSRSANRGECVGCCRLPYTLKHRGHVENKEYENKYLLSMKELNTSTRFKDLIDSNITSFKIEGRMKSPEYVGFITKFYRNLLDNYSSNIDIEEENNKLKTIFNREFTLGYLFDTDPEDLINSDSPNHIGLTIGKVVGLEKGKIKLSLTRELNQQDGIRFKESGKGCIINYLYDEKMLLESSSHTTCYIDNKVDLTTLDHVNKTLDYKLITSLKVLPKRTIPITFNVTARVGKPFTIILSDGINKLSVVGGKVAEANNAPLTIERLRAQLEKLGDTPYVSTATIINADANIFISIKEINDSRHAIINSLSNIRMNKMPYQVEIKPLNLTPLKITKQTGLSVDINNVTQFDALENTKLNRIYTTNLDLYKRYDRREDFYYAMPPIMLYTTNNTQRYNLTSTYFDCNRLTNTIGDYGLNVYNIYTAYYLYKLGYTVITPSIELTSAEIINLINNYIKTFGTYPNIELIGYGRVCNMLIKGNILKLITNDLKYTLEDNNNRSFPIYYDGEVTHLLNYQSQTIDDLKTLKDYATIRLMFIDEDPETIKKTIKLFQ